MSPAPAPPFFGVATAVHSAAFFATVVVVVLAVVGFGELTSSSPPPPPHPTAPRTKPRIRSRRTRVKLTLRTVDLCIFHMTLM
jgi:hypothetical protein